MVGAVADGVDVRVAGAGVLVHDDAVAAAQPGVRGQLHVRRDADADHGQVGRDALAVGARHGLQSVFAEERGGAGAAADRHAVACVQRGVEGGKPRRRHALEDALFHFQNGGFEALAHRNCRHFQADVAAADDGDAPPGLEVLADGIHVGDAAQVVDAGQVAARHVESARAGTGRQQQLLVAKSLAVGADHRVRLRIHALHADAAAHLDVLGRVEGRRAQVDFLQAAFAGQILLRQGRALVRHMRFLADHDDAAVVAKLSEARRGLSGGMAAADDDDAHAPDQPFLLGSGIGNGVTLLPAPSVIFAVPSFSTSSMRMMACIGT